MIHELKTWNEYMMPIRRGEKTFEVRRNDRNFKVGDTIMLIGWNNILIKESGNWIKAEITYILEGGQFGVEKGFCVMGIKVIDYF